MANRVTCLAFAAALSALGGGTTTHAAVVSNGGFESGFTDWTIASLPFSDGGFALQSGGASPVNGDAVPSPPEGAFAAMTDSAGPGTHVLYQDIVVDAAQATLEFALYIGNRADRFARASAAVGLDFGSPELNQQFRVDLLRDGADPFSIDGADVLLTLYQTLETDPLESGYTTIATSLDSVFASRLGQTVRLRFATVDNLAPLQVGIDAVRFAPTNVPAPASGLFALALLLMSGSRLLRAPAVRRTLLAFGCAVTLPVAADTIPVRMLDPALSVEPFVSAGLVQPVGMVFLAPGDALVLERASGQVKRVLNGVVQSAPVLDLAVNSNSERGLLSVALHPEFSSQPYVYLFWTESSTGADTAAVASVALLGNRVDRFLWQPATSTLVFDRSIARFRARQTDNVVTANHPGTQNAAERGNHNGGVIRFGPDDKLYVFIGDLGRRGQLQNLANGPFRTAPFVDDTFGGPAADDAHLSSAVLRLNDDGTTPADNPFFAVGAALGGEFGANIQQLFSYGHRNGFGMAFDPLTGALWLSENADDAYSEVNRVVPGMNGGWIQFAGPLARIADWKSIETTQFNGSLQQVRYPPTRAAYNASGALARLFLLPGATYVDPRLSWRYEIGPSGATFVSGTALGQASRDTFWFGSARAFQQVGGNGGSLYRLTLTGDRTDLDLSADPRLADRVADNLFRQTKFDGTESETLKIGEGFGTTTDLVQGPDGALYVVSITDGVIYRVFQAP